MTTPSEPTDLAERSAVRAMRDRGITNPDGLLQYASPEDILGACEWWDRQTGVRTGLLVTKIRDGGINPDELPPSLEDRRRERARELRDRFDRISANYAEGAVTETHAAMQQRQWPDDPHRCDGRMTVTENTYPHITVRCDVCAFDAAYPLSQLGVLPAQQNGYAVPQRSRAPRRSNP